MKRKFAPPIQHTVYKTGWKDALHEVGDAIDELQKFPPARGLNVLSVLEERLAKLVPEQ